MSLSNEQWLFLQDVSSLITYAKDKGYKLTGGELYRTKEQQDIYVKEGKSKTYNSNHLKRLAIDFNLFVDGDIIWSKSDEWIELGNYWESLNDENKWGGNYNSFTDLPHFERIVK